MVWNLDGSGLLVSEGAGVKHGGAGGPEKKGNALWEGEAGGSVRCWSFEITGGQGVWLGVGTKEQFGQGYKMKGLLYGGPGNLSDGNSLVTGNWGPKVGEGDVVGLRLEVTQDRVTVAFSKNGEGLGVAFDISGWAGGDDLRPVVSLDSPGQSLVIREGEEGQTFCPAPQTGIEGRWSQGEDCQVSVMKEGGQWRLGVKVANSLSCLVTEGEGGGMIPGPVMSTRMMAPPHLQARETQVRELMEGLTDIVRKGEQLCLKAGDRCEMFDPAPHMEPATKERINWLN